MQKETFFAILIGLMLGLLVTFGVYHFKIRHQEKQVAETEETITETTASPTPVRENLLSLKSPLDGLVTLSQKINVSGTFKPNAYVVESLGNYTKIHQLGDKEFKFAHQISSGPNMIYVIGVNDDGNVYEENRLVVNESLKPNLPEATTAAKPKIASNSSLPISSQGAKIATKEAILARINKKLGKNADAINLKRAILGKVARVTEESITLKNEEGDFILPVDGNVNITTDKGKTLEIKNIAVDSWVLVIGQIDKEAAATVKITPETKLKPTSLTIYQESPVPPKPEVLMGSITELKKTKITLTTRNNNETKEILTSSKTKIYDLADHEISQDDLETDFNLIVVTEKNKKGQLVAKQIKALVEIEGQDQNANQGD